MRCKQVPDSPPSKPLNLAVDQVTPWSLERAKYGPPSCVRMDISSDPSRSCATDGSIGTWYPKGWKGGKVVEHQEVEPTPKSTKQKTPAWLESELHPLVAYFAREHMDGVRTKTVHHSSSKKKSFGEAPSTCE